MKTAIHIQGKNGKCAKISSCPYFPHSTKDGTPIITHETRSKYNGLWAGNLFKDGVKFSFVSLFGEAGAIKTAQEFCA